ncbi:MAG: helix-turn-helix domain-containing protein [Desmonostoc geniculatum HA4340-LM1]|jgi:transcriptional regulator with XRE-family HTH domain|nr:helix-turn-helix domain-containing protein [Desmonostoc geniculatum HA4340-LM1]
MKIQKIIECESEGIGEAIKKARKQDNRSLTQICAEVGMTTSNWYKIENEDTKVLPLDTLRQIEKVLGISLGVDL